MNHSINSLCTVKSITAYFIDDNNNKNDTNFRPTHIYLARAMPRAEINNII